MMPKTPTKKQRNHLLRLSVGSGFLCMHSGKDEVTTTPVYVSGDGSLRRTEDDYPLFPFIPRDDQPFGGHIDEISIHGKAFPSLDAAIRATEREREAKREHAADMAARKRFFTELHITRSEREREARLKREADVARHERFLAERKLADRTAAEALYDLTLTVARLLSHVRDLELALAQAEKGKKMRGNVVGAVREETTGDNADIHGWTELVRDMRNWSTNPQTSHDITRLMYWLDNLAKALDTLERWEEAQP